VARANAPRQEWAAGLRLTWLSRRTGDAGVIRRDAIAFYAIVNHKDQFLDIPV
jgi:hypothetical protein